MKKIDYTKIISLTLICIFPFVASASDDEGEGAAANVRRISSKREIARHNVILKQVEISSKEEELKKMESAYKALRKEKMDILKQMKKDFESDRIKYNKCLLGEKKDRRLGRGPEGE